MLPITDERHGFTLGYASLETAIETRGRPPFMKVPAVIALPSDEGVGFVIGRRVHAGTRSAVRAVR